MAIALRRLGHEVCVFVSKTGPLAEELDTYGIPVVSHPGQAPFKPDLIHGQYNLETIAALLSFPDRPALYLSNGTRQWREHPPLHPRILRYVSLSASGRDWLQEAGIPGSVPLSAQFCGYGAVCHRSQTPEEPVKALLYDRSSGAGRDLDDIRQACLRCNIQLQFVGDLVGRGPTRPEVMLPEYDLVFASGRSAIEALASGCAVVPGPQRALGQVGRDRELRPNAGREFLH